HTYNRSQIDFAYRQSHLNHLIVTQVVFQLTPGELGDIKASLNKCMTYKANSQPLGEKSAGCVFKNPTLTETIEDIADEGSRVSGGLLIDRAGCKGLRVGGATVSEVHANFITSTKDTSARDVMTLIAQVQDRVLDTFNTKLDREVVIWSDHPQETHS